MASRRQSFIQECIFLIDNNIKLSERCEVWKNKQGWIFNSVVSMIDSEIQSIVPLIDAISVIACIIALYHIDRQYKTASCWYYVLNPLVWFGLFYEPLGSMFHLRLLMLITLVSARKRFATIVILSDLVISDIVYICLMPFIFLHFRDESEESSKSLAIFISRIKESLLISLLCIAIISLYIVYIDNGTSLLVMWFNFDLKLKSRYFEPTLFNLWWYLDGEVFSEHASYVMLLKRIQPFLLSLPLFFRFGNDKSILCVMIMMAIIAFYENNISCGHVGLIAALMLGHLNIIEKMKHIGLTTLCLSVGLILSPTMYELWVVRGTGNANFLFFQSLVITVFTALWIVEFVVAVVIIDSSKKDDLTVKSKVE